MLLSLHDAGLGAIGAAHEYGMSQWEINLPHSRALDAADRAFRFKAAVKDLATREGLLATFMGKPFNGDARLRLPPAPLALRRGRRQRLRRRRRRGGLRELLRHFIAGVIEHAPALMAFLNPTVNAYRRIDPHELVPTRACWGYDNRFGARARPARARRRDARRDAAGDGSANPYLATAALLFAGLDGVERELTPPAPVAGLVYELPEEEQGDPIPLTLDAALDALEADARCATRWARCSSRRSSRSSASSWSATTATSPTGIWRSTPTTSRRPGSPRRVEEPLPGGFDEQVAHAGAVRERREAVGLGGQRGRLHVVRRTLRSPSARSRVAVPSVRKMTSRPRSTAWRAVESQHMWVMKPPITRRRTPNW